MPVLTSWTAVDKPEVAVGARDLLGTGAIADGIADEIAPNLRQSTMRARYYVMPAEVCTHAFALLDVRRALRRLRAASADKPRRLAIDELVVTCDELVNDLIGASIGEERARIANLADRMGGL